MWWDLKPDGEAVKEAFHNKEGKAADRNHSV